MYLFIIKNAFTDSKRCYTLIFTAYIHDDPHFHRHFMLFGNLVCFLVCCLL